MTSSRWKLRAAIAVVLVSVVVVAFAPVLDNGFVAYDDEHYVTDNRHVQAGLTAAGFVWAWTTFHASNWHPLTWLSHQLDQELFGNDPAGHHFTSLLLHVLNSVLLFWALERLTASPVRSAFVALLFGMHPLHVESVAWVAERKDVLSTMFWMLAIVAWTAYARSPGIGRYLVVVLMTGLGLCAKPMLVTVPLTLLLLDFWPLQRLDSPRALGRLLLEKLPLLALSAASSIVTVFAQRTGGAVVGLETYPVVARLGNAVVSYAIYLRRTFWPTGLAVPYPHPGDGLPVGAVATSVVVLAAISALAVAGRQRHRYLLFGWLWFLITLVPVIGIVQVGPQAMADRYTYVPLIGVFVILAWGIPSAVGPSGSRPATSPGPEASAVQRDTGLLAIALVAVPVLTAVTWGQIAHWRDEETLARRALAVTENNAIAHNRLGLVLARAGEIGPAMEQYDRALDISPGFADAHNNLAGALVEAGRLDEGIARYRQALSLRPVYPEAQLNLGVALVRAGRLDDAIGHFERALELRPGYGKAHANLAAAAFTRGDVVRAWGEIAAAQRHGFEPPPALVRSVEAALRARERMP